MNELRGLWRGKVKDEVHSDHNGEWIEGDLICDKMSDGYISYGIASRERGEILVYEVDPNTLGECAGAPDKNGKPIFEGDVVVWDYDETDLDGSTHTTPGAVFWDGELCGFFVGETAGDIDDKCRVIGNIYDSPDLLKGGKYDER